MVHPIIEAPHIRQRGAGAPQGWMLVAVGWLAVASGLLLAPILPRMTEAFASSRAVDVKIRLVATLPALFVALLSVAWGALADRVGRKRVLLWAIGLYAIVGVAPFWLGSLNFIVVSRAFVGVAEAAILTCSTAMIGDYFQGAARSRWFALQTGTAPIIATLMLAIGGTLGESNWRMPFAVYGLTILFVPLGLACLWETSRETGREPLRKPDHETAPMRWGGFLGICLLTLFATTAFLVPIIQFGFLATARGLMSPGRIGLWSAVSSVANMAGAAVFVISQVSVTTKLSFSFAAMACGFAVMALGPGYQSVVVGASIANLGSGCVVPALITWALAGLAQSHRGRGTGLWMSANFLGQFLSPLIVLALVHRFGTLDRAILIYAVACVVATVAMAFIRIAPRDYERAV